MRALGHLLTGDVAAARADAAECLSLAIARDDHWRASSLLAECAEIAHRDGELRVAARLAAAAVRQREEYGVALHPDSRAMYERWLGALRRDMGDLAFETAWAKGEELTREAAMLDAAAVLARQSLLTADSTVPPAVRLTRREREVLALLADGASNHDIAEALSLAHRTAETHVRRLCHKLGVESRTAAVAAAYRLHVLP
jgi:ATP/maltotriose-dependent transcriptional regulator MalT